MVSVIIPTYNYAKYIEETLNSVKNQSYANWECIVIDDGSNDNTREIVEKLVKQDNRFIYIYQKNNGVSSARNKGVSMAKGEYIQFLDGDDLLQQEKLFSQIKCFEEDKKIDIVYNDVRFFDDENSSNLKTSLNGNKKEDWMPKISTSGTALVEQFSRINFIVINSPLIKKNIFNKVGVFDETMKALEDWDFWMRCAIRGCYFHFNSISNAYALVRVHDGSLSTQKLLMNAGHFMFLRNSLNHKNIGFKSRLVISIKYVELFWDSLFGKGQFESKSIVLALFSIIMVPFYLIIKLVRSVK